MIFVHEGTQIVCTVSTYQAPQEEGNSWTRALASDLTIYENFIILVKNDSRLTETWWQV